MTRARGSQGSALVELALVLPLLVLIMVGATDFARLFYTAIELTNAARAGAQFGSANLGNSGNVPGMQNAATGSINISGVTANASRLCRCATDDGATFGASIVCNVPCPAGQHLVVTVTVTTDKVFTTSAHVPPIPTSLSLSRTATLRVVN